MAEESLMNENEKMEEINDNGKVNTDDSGDDDKAVRR